jgi:hypothetical protein
LAIYQFKQTELKMGERMKRLLFVITMLVPFLTTAIAKADSANLIANGSFESPVIATNSYQQVTPSSWTFSGATGYIFNDFTGTIPVAPLAAWPLAQDGQQYVDIGNVYGGSLSLLQTFTVTTSGPYKLSWHDNAATGYPYAANYDVSISNNLNNVIADSGTINANHGDGSWQLHKVLDGCSGPRNCHLKQPRPSRAGPFMPTTVSDASPMSSMLLDI